MKRFALITGILLLFATEILRVYFIMPFPGSQHSNTIGLAYFIDRNRLVLRLIGLALVIVPLYSYLINGKTWSKILLSVVLIFYGIVFYFFNFRFEADKMFYQPKTKNFATVTTNKIPSDRLVIGVVLNGEARAYPIQVIGYHHQVRDTVGSTPVMITYCTVCRTGRVFSPLVNGRAEDFRLVGMDHFNAMFEDARTRSWWQQATGVSIAGPLKNTQLAELPSSQSSLAEWVAEYPDTKILQPDTFFTKRYDDLKGYDSGTIKGHLERRDSASWKPKSWVVGVRSGGSTKAYDWNDFTRTGFIQDTIGSRPIMLVLGSDGITFHVWDRNVQGQELRFEQVPGIQPVPGLAFLRDNTGSTWSFSGKCLSGKFKDHQLQSLPSYQEFWHSWNNFHPLTTVYKL
jgi:hypothetical protein